MIVKLIRNIFPLRSVCDIPLRTLFFLENVDKWTLIIYDL